jgi:UDPglucose 6-dehydrogenase
MRVSIIGAGYVGLISGVCLAAKGHQVACVDLDSSKVISINAGIPPIYEFGLADLLRQVLDNGNFSASNDLSGAVFNSEITLIAVGTPFGDGEIDLRYIEESAHAVGLVLRDKSDYHCVVVKSTVVPGTTDSVVFPILEKASGKFPGERLGIGMNPEFLREGVAIEDFMHPDRIVIGGIDKKAIDVISKLYSVFPDVMQFKSNCRTAEMIKYASNSMFATLISFSNEIGNLCSSIGGIDVLDVMKGVHYDKRFFADGPNALPLITSYLKAGCGFGGSCFPKDIKALIAHGKKYNNDLAILNAVISTNERQPLVLVELLRKHFEELRGIKVAILGVAFKAGTDDIRESPAIPVIMRLWELGVILYGYDPIASEVAKNVFENGEIIFIDSMGDAIKNVDAIILVTHWPEFDGLSKKIQEQIKVPLVIDGRRQLDKTLFSAYEGIGL